MSKKKYIIDKSDSIVYNNKILYRIKAVKDFGLIKKDYYGGFIESEDNLSQTGNCWLYDGSICYGNAKIMDDAIVCDATVFGNAQIKSKAKIYGTQSLFICDNAIIGDCWIDADAGDIYGNAVIDHDAYITRGLEGKCINIC